MDARKNQFYFLGQGPFSKSLLNRALIVKSWFPDFLIKGSSTCEDILVMTKALQDLKKKKREIYCGLSATALRFLAFRVSREKGEFLLTGDRALFDRPFQEAVQILSQLSVHSELRDKGFFISSEGWKIQGDGLYIPSQTSSQYASALILNSWNLEQDIYFTLQNKPVSESYFQMTLDFLNGLDFVVKKKDKEFFIPKNQNLKVMHYHVERDKSCLFSLACFAAFHGRAIFLDWEETGLQPDHIFQDIFRRMNIPIQRTEGKLMVSKATSLAPLNFDLKGTPDLFPLLSILCSKAEGLSQLRGLSHLAFKESNRLNQVQELLKRCGISFQMDKNQISICGKKTWPKILAFEFDSKKDHRMLMAAELIFSFGVPIKIFGKDSINKSFPEFYSFISSLSKA